MKISFFETDKEDEGYLIEHLSGEELSFNKSALNEAALPSLSDTDAEIVSVFVGSEVTGKVLDAFSSLKLIATRSTGYDHIDIEECRKRGIAVANVPTYGEYTVAEYAFALILTLSRRIYDAYNQVREAGNFSVKGLRGFDLYGKTLGVIGTGHIGRYVVRIAKGFGMNVLGFDVKPDEKFADEAGFEYREFDDVLAGSDIVTLHVPYLRSTHHLMNEGSIGKMKKGSYLINTSRGPVVDTEALVRALKSGHLAGAGLDVLEEEGITHDEFGYVLSEEEKEHDLRIVLANHILIDMPNVIVTPHNAFNTRGGWERILKTTVDNIANFKANKKYAKVG